MTRIERKLLVQTVVLGAVLTAVVVVADAIGWLAPLERWAYDQRARKNQRYTPPPSDRLVHVSIDDRALESVGNWPWSRARIAGVIDELKRAGAEAIALDIIYPDPELIELPQPDGTTQRHSTDGELASAIERAGNVLMPIAFHLSPRRPDVYNRLVELLGADLELAPDELVAQLGASGSTVGKQAIEAVDKWMIQARRDAMYRRIVAELEGAHAAPSFDFMRAKLLPTGANQIVTDSPMLRLLKRQLDRARAMQALSRFSRPSERSLPGVVKVQDKMPPIYRFSRSLGAVAFVDYVPDADGVVRAVPLCVQHRGRLYPQFGLALACMMLGVDFKDLRLERDRLVIPLPDAAELSIPVFSRFDQRLDQDVGLMMYVPWRGPTENWVAMYDPRGRESINHLSITSVTAIQHTQQAVRTNIAALDNSLKVLLKLIDVVSDTQKLVKFTASPFQPDDLDARKDTIVHVIKLLDDLKEEGWLDPLEGAKPEDMAPDEIMLLRSIEIVRTVPAYTRALIEQLSNLRAQLSESIDGRAVIIGWSATGVAADFVPTPIFSKCPGAVIHGAVFNAIMTDDLWRSPPLWVTPMLTFVVGFAVALAVATLSPVYSTVVAAVLAVGYFFVNGALLFDYGDTIIGIAGPLTAIALVWSGLTLFRFVVERWDRHLITRRFRNYVDPRLVDYVLEHPDQAQLDGKEAELTVVFTDLAGFTTLTEKLRRQTVGIVNEYLELMVPIISSHNGYVNKFLGDGIMFFYGAPQGNPFHAMDAVMSALKMQQAMPQFNRHLAGRDLPPINMRVGISTGPMVVGDAGSLQRSDYTVLGDAVNLGARLESANKETGTWILINDRAAMMVADRFLLRPVGRLQVVGKSQGVMTFEPISTVDDATDEQKRLAEMCNDMVNAYIRGQFSECIERADELDKAFGPSVLTALYVRISREFLDNPPDADFVGQIVLEAK